jgi:signal transduction histidine kinase
MPEQFHSKSVVFNDLRNAQKKILKLQRGHFEDEPNVGETALEASNYDEIVKLQAKVWSQMLAVRTRIEASGGRGVRIYKLLPSKLLYDAGQLKTILNKTDFNRLSEEELGEITGFASKIDESSHVFQSYIDEINQTLVRGHATRADNESKDILSEIQHELNSILTTIASKSLNYKQTGYTIQPAQRVVRDRAGQHVAESSNYTVSGRKPPLRTPADPRLMGVARRLF